MRAHEFEHAARAGAGVEEALDRLACHVAQDRRFDVLLGRMQRADAFPLRRVRLEIGSSFCSPFFTHGGEALEVGVGHGGIK